MTMFPAIKTALYEWWSSAPEPTITDLGLKAATVNEGVQDWYARNGFYGLHELHTDGGSSWSGEAVNETAALNHSVVWACVRLVSNAIASIPLNIHVSSTKERAEAHPLYEVLHYQPNSTLSSFEFRQRLQAHMLLWGNAYAMIRRRSGTNYVVALDPIHPSRVKVEAPTMEEVRYQVKVGDKWEPVPMSEMLHVRNVTLDGQTGESVLAVARQSMGTALSTEKYAGKYFKHGGRQPGYIKLQRRMADADQDAFRHDLESFLNSSDNYGRIPFFPPDVEFKEYAWPPEASQFLESRQFSVPEICRWFGVQPHLVGDLSRSTNNNIEHQSLEFVQHTIRPIAVAWEGAMRRCLLSPVERTKFFIEFNLEGLQRGDYQSRTSGYASLLQNGVVCINEVRALENMTPRDGGDALHFQLNQQTVPGSGEPTTAELAQMSKIQDDNRNKGGDDAGTSD